MKNLYDRIAGKIATNNNTEWLKYSLAFVIGTLFGQSDYKWIGLILGSTIAMILITFLPNKAQDTNTKTKQTKSKQKIMRLAKLNIQRSYLGVENYR